MEWDKLFNSGNQPTYEDMEKYIGGDGLVLWNDLFAHMKEKYTAKPKMSYSVCSGKPGWNVKFQKSGVSFGTFYPEQNSFSVFTVISYKLDKKVEALKPKMSKVMQKRYDSANDFMKMGKYMMFQIAKKRDLDDYKILISAKSKKR